MDPRPVYLRQYQAAPVHHLPSHQTFARLTLRMEGRLPKPRELQEGPRNDDDEPEEHDDGWL